MTEKSKAPQVNGITEADFNTWKHHPVTKVLHQFLGDYAEALKSDHLGRWLAGEDDPAQESLARGRIITATELKALKFQDIAEFYRDGEASVQGERNEEEDGRETD